MAVRRIAYVLLMSIIVVLVTGSPARSAPTAQTPSGVTVARVYYADRAQLARLTAQYDVWEVHTAEQYVVVALTQAEYATLGAEGYRRSIDLVKTIAANMPRVALPGQINGIPGYTCYRTVEETYAAAQALATAHPNLAQWIDIGDSWDKVTAGGATGYDMMVLKLNQSSHTRPQTEVVCHVGHSCARVHNGGNEHALC